MTKEKKHTISNPEKRVDLYGDYIYNYAISRVFSLDIAQDLVQDTFLAAIKAKKSFRGDSSEQTWLIAILKRKIIDYFRKKGRKKESAFTNLDNTFQKDGDFSGKWLETKAPIESDLFSDKNLENDELKKVLLFCLSLLPIKWAAVFSMKVVDEESTENVCKEMEISKANLWVIIHRAKLQLQECLQKEWLKQ